MKSFALSVYHWRRNNSITTEQAESTMSSKMAVVHQQQDVTPSLPNPEWGQDSIVLKDFVKKHETPCVVKVVKGHFMNIGVPKFPLQRMHQEMFVHSVKSSVKVFCHSVRVRTDTSRAVRRFPHTVMSLEQRLSVPLTYQGWFEVLSEDGRGAKPIDTVHELAKKFPEKCLVRQNVKAYVANLAGKLDLEKSRIVNTGELLTLSGGVTLPTGNSKLRLLRCVDGKGESVYLSFDQKGAFTPIAGKEGITGVHTIREIVIKFRLPLTVKLIQGVWPKVDKSRFTGAMRLDWVYSDECAFVCPLIKDQLRMLPIPTDCAIKLLPANNMKDIHTSESYKLIMHKCNRMLSNYNNTIHLITAAPEVLMKSKQSAEAIHSALYKPTQNSRNRSRRSEKSLAKVDRRMDEIDDLYQYVRDGGLPPKFTYDSDEESYWEEPEYETLDDFRARLNAIEQGSAVPQNSHYTPTTKNNIPPVLPPRQYHNDTVIPTTVHKCHTPDCPHVSTNITTPTHTPLSNQISSPVKVSQPVPMSNHVAHRPLTNQKSAPAITSSNHKLQLRDNENSTSHNISNNSSALLNNVSPRPQRTNRETDQSSSNNSSRRQTPLMTQRTTTQHLATPDLLDGLRPAFAPLANFDIADDITIIAGEIEDNYVNVTRDISEQASIDLSNISVISNSSAKSDSTSKQVSELPAESSICLGNPSVISSSISGKCSSAQTMSTRLSDDSLLAGTSEKSADISKTDEPLSKSDSSKQDSVDSPSSAQVSSASTGSTIAAVQSGLLSAVSSDDSFELKTKGLLETAIDSDSDKLSSNTKEIPHVINDFPAQKLTPNQSMTPVINDFPAQKLTPNQSMTSIINVSHNHDTPERNPSPPDQPQCNTPSPEKPQLLPKPEEFDRYSDHGKRLPMTPRGQSELSRQLSKEVIVYQPPSPEKPVKRHASSSSKSKSKRKSAKDDDDTKSPLERSIRKKSSPQFSIRLHSNHAQISRKSSVPLDQLFNPPTNLPNGDRVFVIDGMPLTSSSTDPPPSIHRRLNKNKYSVSKRRSMDATYSRATTPQVVETKEVLRRTKSRDTVGQDSNSGSSGGRVGHDWKDMSDTKSVQSRNSNSVGAAQLRRKMQTLYL